MSRDKDQTASAPGYDAPPVIEPVSGRTFGDFAVKERIGEGGAGEVYRAEQVSLGREAVIKVMTHRNVVSNAAADRFLREARLASRLDHPFAAHVYAFGVAPDATMWIAMELVRGTPLNKLIASQGRIPLPRFVPLFERLCEVLNAAHEQNIVHRDIKPANVMVIQRAGRLMPKLLDLGIARATQTAEVDVEGHLEVEIPDRAITGETTSDEIGSRLTQSESMQLTAVGSVVGTPHYMAPEQWVDASNVGAAADVYSLAILAYQCITGAVPFTGTSLKALARAHATHELPKLGPEFPEALHGVLSKGAAKIAAHRFATPLEFSAALRAASGVGVEPPSLPGLDEGLRDNILSEAPQPLAEAVAALESARTWRQATEAAGLVLRIMCRLCGVLSLAARLRVGPGVSNDTVPSRELLKTLRASGLDDSQWVSLTKALLAPFARQRDAHPLPELVRFFFDDSGPGVGLTALESLLALPSLPKDASDEQGVNHLEGLVPLLGRLIQSATFLFDYTLVVQRDVPERWMGTRRARRRVHYLETPAQRGEVLLIDSVGVCVLVLSPLVQCFSPSASAQEELFFLDGHGRHGARLVAWPSSFEHQDDSVWAHLTQKGLALGEANIEQTDQQAPYKGLATFSPDDADRYFGREREAEAFANRLRSEPFLAVVGPSGTGKSSFVLAGVLPLFRKGWRPAVFRPGPTPLAALGAKLLGQRWEPLVATATARADAVAGSVSEGEVVVLVVDQFEELVTLCQDAEHRLDFARTLLAMAHHPSGRLRVVVTLRDDFLIKVQALAPFRDTLARSLELLSTPAPEDLQRVVTEPARRVSYSFDDKTLPERMVAAVAEYPGALALLSFTASQLWELRDRHLQLMRAKTYEALGGVGGALAHHAEATLASLSGTEQPLVREVFRNLVTSQGTRAVLSTQEMRDVLGGGSTAQTVLDKLIGARLLVSSEMAGGDDAVEIIHEALIVSWPRLVAWQREDAEAARLRDALRASARQWVERGRPTGLLWRKETLAEFRRWRARSGGHLTQAEEAFARASLRDEARAIAIRRALAATAFIALAIGLILVTRAYGEATRRLQRLWQEQGRLAMLQSKPMQALVYSRAAKEAGAAGPALEHVLTAATVALEGSRGVITKLDGLILGAAISPDHQWLVATTQAQVVLIALKDHSVRQRWPWSCEGLAFTADSKRALLSCSETLRVFALDSGQLREVPAPTRIVDLQPMPDGQFIGTAEGDTVYRVSAEGTTTPFFKAPQAPFVSVNAASDGTVVVYAGVFEERVHTLHTVSVLSASGTVLFETERFEDTVVRARLDPATGWVALAYLSGSVAVFDSKTHRRLWELRSKAGPVTLLHWRDQRLYTLALSGVFSAYAGATGDAVFSEPVSRSALSSLIFDGPSGFVAGVDGVVRKVDAESGGVLWEHHGHQGVVTALVHTDDEVISVSHDGLIWRWVAAHPAKETFSSGQMTGGQATRQRVLLATQKELLVLAPDGGIDRAPFPSVEDSGPICTLDVSKTGRVLIEFVQRAVALEQGRVVWQHPRKTQAATLSDDGHVAVAETDGVINIYDPLAPAAPLWSTRSKETAAMLYFDRLLVGDSSDGSLLVWQVGDATTEAVRLPAHPGGFRLTRTSLPDVFLTLGEDRSIIGWHVEDRPRELFRVKGLQSRLWNGNVSNDLKTVTTVTTLGALRVYDIATGKQLSETFLGARPDVVAIDDGSVFSPDLRGLATRTTLKPGHPGPEKGPECRLSIALANEDLAVTQPAPCGAD